MIQSIPQATYRSFNYRANRLPVPFRPLIRGPKSQAAGCNDYATLKIPATTDEAGYADGGVKARIILMSRIGRDIRKREYPGRAQECSMAYSESLAQRIRQAFARRRGITEKKMFGGVGFLLNGNMCVGIWKNSLIVRLQAEDAEAALKEPNVVEFDITGRPMKGWIMVEPDGIETDEQLAEWIRQASDFVSTLPSK